MTTSVGNTSGRLTLHSLDRQMGETGKLKGRVNEFGHVEIYTSQKGAGLWGKLFHPMRAFEKQGLAKDALLDAVEGSYGPQMRERVRQGLAESVFESTAHLDRSMMNEVKDFISGELAAAGHADAAAQVGEDTAPMKVDLSRRPGRTTTPGGPDGTETGGRPRADALLQTVGQFFGDDIAEKVRAELGDRVAEMSWDEMKDHIADRHALGWSDEYAKDAEAPPPALQPGATIDDPPDPNAIVDDDEADNGDDPVPIETTLHPDDLTEDDLRPEGTPGAGKEGGKGGIGGSLEEGDLTRPDDDPGGDEDRPKAPPPGTKGGGPVDPTTDETRMVKGPVIEERRTPGCDEAPKPDPAGPDDGKGIGPGADPEKTSKVADHSLDEDMDIDDEVGPGQARGKQQTAPTAGRDDLESSSYDPRQTARVLHEIRTSVDLLGKDTRELDRMISEVLSDAAAKADPDLSGRLAALKGADSGPAYTCDEIDALGIDRKAVQTAIRDAFERIDEDDLDGMEPGDFRKIAREAVAKHIEAGSAHQTEVDMPEPGEGKLRGGPDGPPAPEGGRKTGKPALSRREIEKTRREMANVNEIAGAAFLRQIERKNEFGVLLELARDPDRKDMLGDRDHFPPENALFPPAVTMKGARAAIHKAFRTLDRPISSLDQHDRRTLVIDALKNYVRFPEVGVDR